MGFPNDGFENILKIHGNFDGIFKTTLGNSIEMPWKFHGTPMEFLTTMYQQT